MSMMYCNKTSSQLHLKSAPQHIQCQRGRNSCIPCSINLWSGFKQQYFFIIFTILPYGSGWESHNISGTTLLLSSSPRSINRHILHSLSVDQPVTSTGIELGIKINPPLSISKTRIIIRIVNHNRITLNMDANFDTK